MTESRSAGRPATILGLAIALLGIPAIVIGFRAALGEISTTPQYVVKEVAILAMTGVLLWIVVRKERRPLGSIGLGTSPVGKSILWSLVGLLLCAAGVALSFGLAKLLGWPFGGARASAYQPPLWAVLLTVVRAATSEEICYRGYAIERLQSLTGIRAMSVGIPLALFAAFHYRQGYAGILVALVTGAVLTVLYLRRRDLTANILTHFLGDLIPNVLLSLSLG